MLPFNYIGTLHFAKDYPNGMIFLGATYWYVIIIGVTSLTLSRTLGLVKFAQRLEKKSKGGQEPKK